ncbi:actin-like protein 6B [Angomonas deanei]|nr:actin-like protein 6B [Angomonas deanei]|eukprot:EPY39863.1 actin-like protein 6B [Angomonas deanei]
MAVVEVGSYRVRGGYVGDLHPTVSLPALLSKGDATQSDFMSILQSSANRNTTESDILPLWTLQSLQSNVEHHVRSIRHIKHNLLKCKPEDPLMLVIPEVWQERSEILEGLTELFLEDGEENGIASSLYFSRPLVNIALANAKVSALVCDVGHSHVTVGAVLDGHLLRQTLNSLPLGGAVVTSQFQSALEKQWRPWADEQAATLCRRQPHHQKVISDYLLGDLADRVKRMSGEVHLDEEAQEELEKGPGRKRLRKVTKPSPGVTQPVQMYTPDGNTFSLNTVQRSKPFEVFFGGMDEAIPEGASKLHLVDFVANCKNLLDPEWQLRGVHHIVAGGGAQAASFTPRLLQELKKRDTSYYRLEEEGCFTTTSQKNDAWAGASMSACSSAFSPMWITRREWQEEGASVLHRKLFL